jgi:hypothetical protein
VALFLAAHAAYFLEKIVSIVLQATAMLTIQQMEQIILLIIFLLIIKSGMTFKPCTSIPKATTNEPIRQHSHN